MALQMDLSRFFLHNFLEAQLQSHWDAEDRQTWCLDVAIHSSCVVILFRIRFVKETVGGWQSSVGAARAVIGGAVLWRRFSDVVCSSSSSLSSWTCKCWCCCFSLSVVWLSGREGLGSSSMVMMVLSCFFGWVLVLWRCERWSMSIGVTVSISKKIRQRHLTPMWNMCLGKHGWRWVSKCHLT